MKDDVLTLIAKDENDQVQVFEFLPGVELNFSSDSFQIYSWREWKVSKSTQWLTGSSVNVSYYLILYSPKSIEMNRKKRIVQNRP